jgi:hypothetical protein
MERFSSNQLSSNIDRMSNEALPTGSASAILDVLYDRALGRLLDDMDLDPRDYLTADERTQWETAQREELERIVRGPQYAGKVVVEVLGGVAEVTAKPENIDVEIIDHDNEDHSRAS